MTNTTVLMTDMAILVGIFLLGLLAKLFPRTGKNHAREQQQFAREQQNPEKR
jgi:hypothetical protein